MLISACATCIDKTSHWCRVIKHSCLVMNKAALARAKAIEVKSRHPKWYFRWHYTAHMTYFFMVWREGHGFYSTTGLILLITGGVAALIGEETI